MNKEFLFYSDSSIGIDINPETLDITSVSSNRGDKNTISVSGYLRLAINDCDVFVTDFFDKIDERTTLKNVKKNDLIFKCSSYPISNISFTNFIKEKHPDYKLKIIYNLSQGEGKELAELCNLVEEWKEYVSNDKKAKELDRPVCDSDCGCCGCNPA